MTFFQKYVHVERWFFTKKLPDFSNFSCPIKLPSPPPTNGPKIMKRLFFLSCFLLPALHFAQKAITNEDIWQKNAFVPKGVPGFVFQNDGVHYTLLKENSIRQFDLRTGAETAILFDKNSVTGTPSAGSNVSWDGKFEGYEFSNDEQKLLLTTVSEPVYRRSSSAQYFVFDFSRKELSKLADGDKQQNARFSPDGSKIAFMQANNLFFKDLTTQTTTQVTYDGKKNEVINGGSDWVYEEEFSLVRTFDWSPDSKKLAWLRFDERAVPEFSLAYYKGDLYPQPYTFKYPKVGEKNATVSALIYDLSSGKTTQVSTGSVSEDYIPRLQWTPSPPQRLCLTTLNRHQNDLRLLLADPETGTCSILLNEKNQKYIDLVDDLRFLQNGTGFIWSSEKSGFRQLYFHDMTGKELRQLTKGKTEVTTFYGLDENNGMLFYQTVGKNPWSRDIFSIKLDGKGKKKLTRASGWHDAQFSSTYDYFVKTFSTINQPSSWTVFNRKGKGIRVIEDNAALAAKMTEYGAQPAKFFSFKTSENIKLNGWMIKPPPEKMGGKHPLLMFVYGGPGNQQVTDQWKGNNYWWFQLLAQRGYVVACIDNRGTGGRGESFKKTTYLQLGHLETIDQIESAKYLGSLSFIDPARIGIFGWSYGGFMSSSCIFKGSGTFKTAIAVAPVTNWKWYDSIYTERYMQTHEENPQGYENNSPINFAEKLSGNFLLIHGEADDNVHFQHTAELTNKLISSGKHFDTMLYPNRNHGISGGGARLHLYTLMTNFLLEKL